MPLHSDQFNIFTGTIPAGGSLSQVIDTEGYDLQGLGIIQGAGTLVPGTIQFRVGWVAGTLYPLNDGSNVRVGIPHGTGSTAYSFVAVQAIRPYRYVQIETSVAQGNGASIKIPVKL